MRFDWDHKKATLNRLKHGISFDLAITAFDDPSALIARDEKHSTGGELRESLIGESDKGVLVIIFTIREPGNIYRIISARKANKKERSLYEVFKK
jgi:uncharacterized DUF497 family protein